MSATLLIATGPDAEGCTHPSRLALVHRNVEPFGHFLVARIAGTRDPHDYRLPKEVPYFPRDAVELSPAEVERWWHSDSGPIPTALALRAVRNARRAYGLRALPY